MCETMESASWLLTFSFSYLHNVYKINENKLDLIFTTSGISGFGTMLLFLILKIQPIDYNRMNQMITKSNMVFMLSYKNSQ